MIDGVDIKDIKMTQNGLGEYVYNEKTKQYADIAMKDFEKAKLSPPSGYKLYKNGSHQTTAVRRAQLANDISKIGRLTGNLDFKVTALYRSGGQSYVQGTFEGSPKLWSVHSANDYVKVGDIIKAGEPIADCVYNHFHFFMTGVDFWVYYMGMDNKPKYKIGDKLKFLSAMNIRLAPSTSSKITGKALKGAVGEIYKVDGVIDGWQWYKLRFGDTIGWMAGSKRNELTDKVVTNADSSPAKPVDPCADVKEALKISEGNNKVLTAKNIELQKSDDLLRELSTILKKIVADY